MKIKKTKKNTGTLIIRRRWRIRMQRSLCELSSRFATSCWPCSQLLYNIHWEQTFLLLENSLDRERPKSLYGTILEQCGMKEFVISVWYMQWVYSQPNVVIACASQEEPYNEGFSRHWRSVLGLAIALPSVWEALRRQEGLSAGSRTEAPTCQKIHEKVLSAMHPGHPCHVWKVEKNIRMML